MNGILPLSTSWSKRVSVASSQERDAETHRVQESDGGIAERGISEAASENRGSDHTPVFLWGGAHRRISTPGGGDAPMRRFLELTGEYSAWE